MTIRIKCFEREFSFEVSGDNAAWYDFDYAESYDGDASLRINADREVYAVFTDDDGTEYYGTIGDEENETLADNFPVSEEDAYIFYENPNTKDFMLSSFYKRQR